MGDRARAALTAVLATLVAALCLTGLAAPPASAQPSPPTDIAFAWGRNQYGQLGDGTTADSSTPVGVHLPVGTRATAIAAGGYHGLALTSDGHVLAWGRNSFGELGDGTTTSSSTPVEVRLPMGTHVTAIAAGINHSLALTSDGRVLAWGENLYGQLGDGTTDNRSTPVEAHLPAGTRATAIAGSTGGFYSLAATSDGRVFAWGINNSGQLGDGTDTNRSTPVEVHLPPGVHATTVAAGGAHSLALASDGRVLAWGFNANGQLGNGTTTNSSTPVETDLPPGVQVTAIAAGGYHSLALTSDGHVLAWGRNVLGQVGDGTTTNRSTPVETDLPPGVHATAVAGGFSHSLALTSDGRVLAWGGNEFGQLGDGTDTNHSSPVQADLPAGIHATAVSGGYEYSLALAVRAASTTTLTASPTTAAPGQPVTLTAHVTCNTATATGEVVFRDGDTPIGTGTLGPDGDAALTTTSLALGAHQITAHYQGSADCPASVSEPVVVVIEQVPQPSLGLTKAVESTGPFQIGDTVQYRYTVTNTGNTALHNVTVTDDLVPTVTCDTATLTPGDSTTCHGGHTITEADITPCQPATGGCLLTNLAQATAVEPSGLEVASEQATATITVQQQQPTTELTLAKRVVSRGPFKVGDTVEYAYTVTNTGDATLHNVTVTDDLVPTVTCDTTSLAPGASTTCHGTYTITTTHLAPCKKTAKDGGYGNGVCCQVTNTAHATATGPGGNRVTSNQATATIQVTAGKHDDCCKQHGGHGNGYGKAKTSAES
ncbi:Ig-like domain repeat protein [Streptomyces sp. NPDC048106]|uniref:RCC1 domain-containing protein n=1 Tax=Streptomyces sp. NPDC048106 TaxID=3155750 RepID=UPI0034551649